MDQSITLQDLPLDSACDSTTEPMLDNLDLLPGDPLGGTFPPCVISSAE